VNFTNIKNFFLNIIFPHRCFVCGKIIDDCGFCEKCLKSKIQFIAQPTCSICGEGLEIGDAMLGSKLVCGSCSSVKHNFDRAISVFIYNDCIAKIMFLFKFKNKFFLSHFLFSYIKDKIKEFEDKIDFIMPVPKHIKKLRIRGYNQSV
jgi:predicted amidophosphoribosyltransferase